MTMRKTVRLLALLLLYPATQLLAAQQPAPAGLFSAPVELTVESFGQPAINLGTPLEFSIASHIDGAARIRFTLQVPSQVELATGNTVVTDVLPSGATRTIRVVAQSKERGDFRLVAQLEFLPDGAASPVIVQQALTLRIRATEERNDIFVEQKHWPKQKLAGRIKAAKGNRSAEEANQALNSLQGTNRPFIVDTPLPPGLLERQGQFLASNVGMATNGALKQQNLGNDWIGSLGSFERNGPGYLLVGEKVPVTFVYRNEFWLTAGQPYVFETRNLSPGADTVAYLLRLDAQTRQLTEIARDDDGADDSLGSRIQFTPDRTGSYVLVVRSYSPDTRGACDIYLNGQWMERTPFGGAAWRIRSDAGDVLHAVGLKRTPNRTDPFLIVTNGPGEMVAADDDSGMELGAKIVLPALDDAEVIVGAYSPALEGTCDLILNTADGSLGPEPRGDLDGDGLSNELERALGTRIDSSDTDSDGLLDEWEAFGIRDMDFRGMGARGTIPDIFVQIDWMASTHNHQPRPAAIARIVDSFLQTGYTLHVDDGNPEEGGEGHLLPDPWTHLEFLNLGGTFDQIMAANFDSAQRGGLYRYNIFAHKQGSPSAPNCSSGVAQLRAFKFIVTLGCAFGQIGTETEQAGTFMHELGHNLGLRHGGFQDLNYKPNYRSVMNYLFQFPGTCGTLGYTSGVTFSPVQRVSISIRSIYMPTWTKTASMKQWVSGRVHSIGITTA